MSDFAPAVEAATKIISFLSESEREIGISEISRGTGINKNMLFRILNTLENSGWVYRREQKYALTLLPFKLTSRVVSRLSLNTAATPILYDLANETGESTYLGIIKDDMVLYIQHIDGVKDVRVAGRIGGEYGLYCSAPGKVLLAYSDTDYIEEYLSHQLEKRTKNTITERAALLSELEAIRRKGYATDREEFGNGISCVAAPVFNYTGKVIGTVGCSAYTVNGDSDTVIKRLNQPVLSSAEKLSVRLGFEVGASV